MNKTQSFLVMRVWDPTIPVAEAGGLLQIQDQSRLHRSTVSTDIFIFLFYIKDAVNIYIRDTLCSNRAGTLSRKDEFCPTGK